MNKVQNSIFFLIEIFWKFIKLLYMLINFMQHYWIKLAYYLFQKNVKYSVLMIFKN